MNWQCRKMVTYINSHSKWGSLVKHREEKEETLDPNTQDVATGKDKKMTKKQLSTFNYSRFKKEGWTHPTKEVIQVCQEKRKHVETSSTSNKKIRNK